MKIKQSLILGHYNHFTVYNVIIVFNMSVIVKDISHDKKNSKRKNILTNFH